MVPVWTRSDHPVKKDRDSQRSECRLCYLQTVKACCWFLERKNIKAMSLVAIRCFSDDTWWTKTKVMKAACLYSAELYHPCSHLHLLLVCLSGALPTLLFQPQSALLQPPRISTYHPCTCNSFFFFFFSLFFYLLTFFFFIFWLML